MRFKLHAIGSMNIISMYQRYICISGVMIINFKYLNVVVSGFCSMTILCTAVSQLMYTRPPLA